MTHCHKAILAWVLNCMLDSVKPKQTFGFKQDSQ